VLFSAKDVYDLLMWHVDNHRFLDNKFIIESLTDVLENDYSDEKELNEWRKLNILFSNVTKEFIDYIKTPNPFSTKLLCNLVNKFAAIEGSVALEQYLIMKKLNEVPGIASRALLIKPLDVSVKPNAKIACYYEQCINCYINGLFDASAVLARSVLQYSLEEILKKIDIVNISGVTTKNYIETLINISINNGVLTSELADKAHKVRKKGNIASHKRSINEHEAKLQIDLLRELLENIF